MQHRPVVRGSDEGEATAEKFKAPRIDCMFHSSSSAFAARRFDKHHRSTCKYRIFQLAARIRPILIRVGLPFKKFVNGRHIALPGGRLSEQTNYLIDTLGMGSSISRGVPVTMAQQKSYMTDDAVTHGTEAG